MNERIGIVLAVIVVGVATLPTVPVGGKPTGESDNLGGEISVFMQSNVVAVSSSVDTGMWTAEFRRTDPAKRTQLVRQRATALERRVERLEAERSELLEQTNDKITVKDRAKAARLTARIENLKQAITHTQQTASVAGVDSAEFEQLQSRASNLDTQQISAVARGLRQNSDSINASGADGRGTENHGRNPSGDENRTHRKG